MSYSNITLVNKNLQVVFTEDSTIYTKIKSYKAYHSDFIFDLVRSEGWTLLIINLDLQNLNNIIQYLNRRKIRKVIFIIDDVFRTIDQKNSKLHYMHISAVEKSLRDVTFTELEIIKKIVTHTVIKKYKIYHCEKIPKYIQKHFRVKINYYDLFLCRWMKYYRKNVSISHFKNFTYTVSSFNKRHDDYRLMLMALFHDNNQFYYTYNEVVPKEDFLNNNQLSIDLFETGFKNLLVDQCNKFYSMPFNKIDAQNIVDNEANIKFANIIQDSFVHLINETRFCSPAQNISEKTIRPIIAKRPFVLAGAPGSLALLKKLGFKTFDRWWSEEYDNEYNHHKRLFMIYELIKEILEKDKRELYQILSEMESVIDHNYELYFNFKTDIYKAV